jgi:hypothetical protein
LIPSPTQFSVESNSSWTLPGSDLFYLGLDSSLLRLKVLIPPWTQTPFQFGFVFLNLLLEFTRTTYPGNLYPIGLPDLTRIESKQLTRTSPEHLTRALPDHINAYLALYIHTQSNYLTRFFSQSGFHLPSLTRSYLTKLPYPIFSRSD